MNDKLLEKVESICPVCSSSFIKSLEHKRYCSKECSKQARKDRQNANARERYHKEKDVLFVCKWCNTRFPNSEQYAKRCCKSEECIEKQRRWKSGQYAKKYRIKKRKERGKTARQKKTDAEVSKRYRSRNREKLRVKDKWRKKVKKDWIENHKTQTGCLKCKNHKHYCLDFHHENSDEKEFGVADVIRKGYSLKRIEEEVKKCIVLCANCHREWHYLESNSGISFDDWLNGDY